MSPIVAPPPRDALLGLVHVRAAGFVRRWAGERFRGGFTLHERKSARGQAVADFAFDLQLHFTGDFHTTAPPLGFLKAAGHVPLRPESANGVMAAFYSPGLFHLEQNIVCHQII